MLIVAAVTFAFYAYRFQPQWLDFVFRPSALEQYERSLQPDEVAWARWQRDQELAMQHPIVLEDGVGIAFAKGPIPATVFQVPVKRGRRLELQLQEQDSLSTFLRIYRNGQWRSWTRDNTVYEHEPKRDDTLQIFIQSPLHHQSHHKIAMVSKPVYRFPVQGKDNRAIQSFWGARRGGGTRTHKGNDIFASKGTPLLAAVDGRITRVVDRGLGGKQVWLRDATRNQSLYYAHLNDWNVKKGQHVQAGDVVGYVGNTGNARTTPPHLHFGIYTSGGAIDPKWFIWKQDKDLDKIIQSTDSPTLLTTGSPSSSRSVSLGSEANLRSGPGTQYDVRVRVPASDTLQVHARLGSWYQVRYRDSVLGMMHKSVLRMVD